MASEDLEKVLYKNWVRGAKGLEYLQEGLQDFVGDKVQLCRNQSLQKIANGLPTGSLYQCNQCTSQNLLPEHAKKKNACNRSTCIALHPTSCFGSKPNGRRKCPNGICSKLYDEIVLDHTSRDPLWKNTDPNTWCSDPVGWSFGKCFQTTTSPGTSADTTDAAGLLSILINNLTIQNDWLACNHMSSTCPFHRARDIRNAILHSPKLELDDPTLGYYLDTFITVLQDAKCLLNCNGSKQAVVKLLQLKNQQINISWEDERTLLKSRKDALSELDEKTKEGLREIDNRTAAALSTLNEDVSKRTSSALSDIEKTRIGARLDIDERKETSLSEIEVAKCQAIDQMKQQLSSIVVSGGEESSIPLCSFQATLSPSAAEDIYLRRKTQLKDDLTTFYKDRHSTIPLSPLFEEHDTPLVNFYVLPQMNEVLKTFSRGEVFKTPVKLLSDIFKSGNHKNREIYLTADAGFGKTAYSKYLAVSWCQAHRPDDRYTQYFSEDMINAMREYEFLFLVLLRDSSNDCSIDDMIVHQIMQNLSRSSSMTIDSLQEILHSERCLVILDGLDEWAHTEKKCPKVPKTIPHRNAREKCTVLTTTRPWKLSVINLNSEQVDKKVELVKLTSESAQTLKEKAISKIKDLDIGKAKHLANALNVKIKDNKLDDLESDPLLLMYLICLWCDDVPLGQSKCGIYTSIIELLLARTMSKYPEMEPMCELSESDIPQCFSEQVQCKKYCTFLKALGELAWETLMSNQKEKTLVFDQSIPEKYLTQDHMKLSLLSGILTQSKQVKLTTQSSKVSFSHKTVQEYFCALYISCQNEDYVKKIILQNCASIENILDMSTVFAFITGINATYISSISRELVPVIGKETSTYRTRTLYDYIYVDPVKDIQNMYISCFKENPDNYDLKLCCQDFIIDEDCREESYFTNLKQLAIHNKDNMQSILINNRGICSLHEIIDSCGLDHQVNIRKIFYRGDCKEEDLLQLLNRSVECVTVRSHEWQDEHFIPKLCSFSNELCKTFQRNSLLQAIYIDCFKMEHRVLDQFLNYMMNRKSMKEIRLYELYCISHDACPGFNLDFTQHSDLRALGFGKIPVTELTVNVSTLEDVDVGPLFKPGLVTSFLLSLTTASKLLRLECSFLESSGDIEALLQILPNLVTVKKVKLGDINLGERSLSLSPEMVDIERVWLLRVTMSATTLREVVSLVEKLPRIVTVHIKNCNITPETEFENVKKYIHKSQNFMVTFDGINQFNQYEFEFKHNLKVELEQSTQRNLTDSM